MLVLPLSLPPTTRPVLGLTEGTDIAPDDAITAMAIAAATPNFIAFFTNSIVYRCINNTASFDAENAISVQVSAKIYTEHAILAYVLL
jgi:hypothetical protein